MSEKVIDTEHRDFPTCPECGHECEDWWDGTILKDDGDEDWFRCEKCDIDFRVMMHLTTTFTTKPKPPCKG